MTEQTKTLEPALSPQDDYPSRIRPYPEMLERQDPVVYGSEVDGPLSQKQLDQFEQDGFLVLPQFFSEREINQCREELASLRKNEQIKQRPEAIIEPDNEELRSLFAVHNPQISHFFSRVAADERLVGMTMQILGSEVELHQSRVNLKPGFAGKEFYWHSDFETWHVEDGLPRMRTVSCSILLTPNFNSNGPLMLIPGSHHRYVTCVGETPENHYQKSLRRQEYGVPDNESLAKLAEPQGIVNAVGPPGTVVLFDCNTMHGSNSNITPYPRSNLFFVYNSIHNRLVPPFGGKKPRPEFIASREQIETVSPISGVFEQGV